jgi:hypothetical protein
MNIIPESGMDEIRQAIKDLVSHGSYEKDGVEQNADIFKTVFEGEALDVYLYIEGEETGQFSNFKLISKLGNDLALKVDSITKNSNKGFLVKFSYKIKEVS